MTFLHHHNPAPSPDNVSAANNSPPLNASTNTANSASTSTASGNSAASSGRRRMSLFSFGLNSSMTAAPPSKNKNLPALSTSPSSQGTTHNAGSKSPSMRSPSSSLPPRAVQSVSPTISPVSETDSLSENPDSHIFERSVQDMAGQAKQEDYIPPALDATAQILSDAAADLDNVEMVYSSRRNSSVIGLNMALGRPYTPSRKNSVYSMTHNGLSWNGSTAAHAQQSSSSLNHSQPAPFGSGLQTSSQPSTSHNQQAQSPVSPPKLMSSRSSVSFYSYADMLNNDEFSRRPSLMHAYSHGVIPTVGRKMSVASAHSGASNGHSAGRERSASEYSKFPRKAPSSAVSPLDSPSQLSKQFKDKPTSKIAERSDEQTSLKKFLISPESSDSEDHDDVFHPASSAGRRPLSRRKSAASNTSFANSFLDNDSFVSSSVGDCIRQCTTEMENN